MRSFIAIFKRSENLLIYCEVLCYNSKGKQYFSTRQIDLPFRKYQKTQKPHKANTGHSYYANNDKSYNFTLPLELSYSVIVHCICSLCSPLNSKIKSSQLLSLSLYRIYVQYLANFAWISDFVHIPIYHKPY